MRWILQGATYVVSKFDELRSTNGLQQDRSFYPLSVISAFYFIAKLRTRKSVNGIQTSTNGRS